MAGDTVITIIGNLTADPEMRFTPSGAAVASFTIASTPRSFDRQAQEWRDGETLFMRCSIWRDAAENVAESLTKGTRVIAQGRLVQRSFTTREGENRTVVEMQVDEIGPSLRYAKAQVTRQPRGGGQGGFNQGGQQGGYQSGGQQGGYSQGSQGGGQQGGYNAGPQGGYNNQGGQQASYNAPQGGAADDPWATGGTTSFGDEPPF
ncbi:single-stranded DNA-binding protein [Actinomyces sp. MRS3W]|uniref:single-stranded DNA-binding protein n=1 Tax=Actinomyces sp. MRS3W TaxID=2800796 RepID=UPI0028FD4A0E|nr:single-stranded DNA-binding protein [Actinomyces sp. MRS3W]MDU0348020.1 single-stranded DNA-binding protein [Actinomyces sp. MRS3W]